MVLTVSVISLHFCLVYYSGTLCKKETNKSEALYSRKYLKEYWLSEFSSIEVTELLKYNKLEKFKVLRLMFRKTQHCQCISSALSL